MKTVSMSYDEAHAFESDRDNVFWDGWTLVIVDESKYGLMNRRGIFFNDKWSVAYKVRPDGRGRWRVPSNA